MPLKLLATAGLLMFFHTAWGAVAAGAWTHSDANARTLAGLATLLVAAGYWGILTSRTRIDGLSIRQTWIWPKQVALAELTQVKLIQVPGLSWLIAPRLVVRTGGLMLTTFHAADPSVLAAFRRLAYG
jgi:hypothetical protein